MEILTKNQNISTLINSQKRPDGQIIEGVYMAMEYDSNTMELIRVYFGTRQSGHMLTYTEDGGNYRGQSQPDYEQDGKDNPAGNWTLAYSRGDYGRNYSHGGHWSGHAKNLHPSIGTTWAGIQEKEDMETELIDIGGVLTDAPYGMAGQLKRTDMDCTGGWDIWYDTAAAAIDARLTPEQITESTLPEKAKIHLLKSETESVLKIKELVKIYEL
jgi:hypothetical protein